MSVSELLQDLRARDIAVWLDGDRLRCSAPSSGLTDRDRAILNARKSEVISFLRTASALASKRNALVPLQENGHRPTIFAVSNPEGYVYCYRPLAIALGPDQPFYGLELPGLDDATQPLDDVGALADYLSDAIGGANPTGPIVIAGYCATGAIAFELACKLSTQGKDVALVLLFGCPYPTSYRFTAQYIARPAFRLSHHVKAIASMPITQGWRYASTLLGRHLNGDFQRSEVQQAPPPMKDRVAARGLAIKEATLRAVRRYRPGRFGGRLGLIQTHETMRYPHDRPLKWRNHAATTELFIGADHDNALHQDLAPATSQFIAGILARSA